MFKESFKSKIILPAVIVLAALVVMLNVFLSVKFTAFSDSLIQGRLATGAGGLKRYLDDCMANSKKAAVSMSFNPDAVRAVKERDTKELLRLFTSTHDLYQINFYTICDGSGVVLARTHAPDNFGDSILGQQNINDALSGKVSSYYEAGALAKVSARTGAPVYDMDGSLVGVVSAGVDFSSDSAAAELKKRFNSEVSVFFGDMRIATTITKNGRSIAGAALNPRIAEIVIEKGQEYSGDADISGASYKTFYKPLFNSKNETFAAIVLAIPLSAFKTIAARFIQSGIFIGLIGLALSIILLFLIISSISKPIILLSGAMDNFANGNLNIDIKTKSGDEVARLGKSLQKVVNIIRKLHENINIMIAEQEKGNTDYIMDTKDFHGDYKLLAENILTLAVFCMKDQLTGMPNRRSVDNRLNSEWHRARRDKTPISVLMIDIDKFKDYNDAYGHQQGDLALQTVAAVFMQSVKRTVDFTARWGGEEFIVLLPNTGADGALNVAEYIRAKVENTVIPGVDKSVSETAGKMTISIGVNTQRPDHASLLEDLISKADKALYRAKETGRNRVCRYDYD